MKKLLVGLLAGLLVVCAGCSDGQQDVNGDPVADGTGNFGYILGLHETEGNYEIAFDEAEWLTATDDADRLRELDLDPETLDDGYYINNPTEDDVNLPLADDVKITVLSFTDWSPLELESAADFAEYFNEYLDGLTLPFWVTVEDGEVTAINMQYIP